MRTRKKPLEVMPDPQALEAGSVCGKDAFKAKLRLTETAYQALVQAGLPRKKLGKRVYLIADQVIRWIEEQGDPA